MKRASVLCVLAALAACDPGTAPTGPFADLRGTWVYTGSQVAPALQLVGTMVVSQQSGDVIEGTLSWEERDGSGGVTVKGGPLSGRVIGLADADFDVLLNDIARRHLSRVSGDTLEGVWAAVTLGQSGEFRAIRAAVP